MTMESAAGRARGRWGLFLWAAAWVLGAALGGCRGGAAAAPDAGALAACLTHYEQARVQLVEDDRQGAITAAKSLADAAQRARASVAEAQAARVDALAAAARALASTDATDDPAVRRAFGEVSRALIGLLLADAALRQGLFLFKCPMAEGYQKWVQPDPKLGNPYMGQRMPRCGSRTRWEP